jgi:hypothetical protein
MKKAEKELKLHLRPRPTETVSLEIPQDAIEALRKIAAHRDMTCQALLKFYIGQGLRHDLANHFADHLLEATALVLARHLQSPEEVSAIVQEIRGEAANSPHT